MITVKKRDSLIFKFAILFTVFIVITILLNGANNYVNQSNIYQKESKEKLESLAIYLNNLIMMEPEEFFEYQELLKKYGNQINIPVNFSGYAADKKKFYEMFNKEYPGKIPGLDIHYEEMNANLQKQYVIYKHRFWLPTFENAARDFGFVYAYYIYPIDEDLHMCWAVDAIREARIDEFGYETPYINLLAIAEDPIESHKAMWETYETGKPVDYYDSYDNEYGKTIAYYYPVVIDGNTIGLIGTELKIDDANKSILQNTLAQSVNMAMILFITSSVMLAFINAKYISKIVKLEKNIRIYTITKNKNIADKIESKVKSKDELATLSKEVASMIREMDEYMKKDDRKD